MAISISDVIEYQQKLLALNKLDEKRLKEARECEVSSGPSTSQKAKTIAIATFSMNLNPDRPAFGPFDPKAGLQLRMKLYEYSPSSNAPNEPSCIWDENVCYSDEEFDQLPPEVPKLVCENVIAQFPQIGRLTITSLPRNKFLCIGVKQGWLMSVDTDLADSVMVEQERILHGILYLNHRIIPNNGIPFLVDLELFMLQSCKLGTVVVRHILDKIQQQQFDTPGFDECLFAVEVKLTWDGLAGPMIQHFTQIRTLRWIGWGSEKIKCVGLLRSVEDE
ncbi:hypothetical protein EMCG_04522 [[Emmonsia] crescens]|uniref:Uncharacterized protein n=1 Tax=[Emmonsia] crescens TaxID=73230 RepID=A0A0G2HSV7_9EURO|nr:hypothetical protein EMCG_04522 [Emmonsia crescens UAMH 3008]